MTTSIEWKQCVKLQGVAGGGAAISIEWQSNNGAVCGRQQEGGAHQTSSDAGRLA